MADQRVTAGIWLVLALVLIGASTAILDVAVVNVAIPSIRSDLHARVGLPKLAQPDRTS